MRLNAKRREIVRLEWKKTQKAIHCPRNPVPAPGAPCPHGRGNGMDDGSRPSDRFHAPFQPRGKTKREPLHVNSDDQTRPCRDDLLDKPVSQSRQARIGGQRGTEPHHSQLVHLVTGLEACRNHRRTANTNPLLFAVGALGSVHQTGCQPVA